MRFEVRYESRRFDETIPAFTEFFGMEVIRRRNDTEWIKHPNTGWLMVLHDAGDNARNKPLMNYYGSRVKRRDEVNRAQQCLTNDGDDYRLPRIRE